MNRKYSIGIFAGVVLLFAVLLSAAYQVSYNHAKAQLAKAETEATPKEETQSIRTEGTAQKEDIYYLKEKNGFVVVYLSDGTTVYEYTNISVDTLPDTIKEQIITGKKVESMQELYGFLENYSS